MNRTPWSISAFVWVFSLLLVFQSCADESESEQNVSDLVEEVSPSGSDDVLPAGECREIKGKETVVVAGITLDMRFPETKYQGDLLILHAWNDAPSSWCSRSRICTKALNKGYRVIMPAMGKTVYAREAYPETRSDWSALPTATFLQDTLIPALRSEYCVLKEDGYNFVIGLSSGARGAVRLLQDQPELFVSAAALSGEYDPSLMKTDNIYRGFLGEYDDHQERWEDSENLIRSVAGMRTPLYLGHGERDDFVPSAQTQRLYNVLRAEKPGLNVRLNLVPDRGNGYTYWNYEISNIFRFFEQAQADLPEGSDM